MTTFLFIITILVALALIGVILIQRSEGGGLGIGSSQGVGSFMTGRGTATLLTRTTAVLAAIFILLCLVMAILNRGTSNGTGKDILAHPVSQQQATRHQTTQVPSASTQSSSKTH